ncbi:uncharacterized protein LOC118201798, partial [Stegodyphus dumicola]|uniref:uncharacterized protein LOC118201798 n=1 Tax=Stegodyphus dumicola TaxID=202533 RepID=UPI0015B18F78
METGYPARQNFSKKRDSGSIGLNGRIPRRKSSAGSEVPPLSTETIRRILLSFAKIVSSAPLSRIEINQSGESSASEGTRDPNLSDNRLLFCVQVFIAEKLWGGRFNEQLSPVMELFNSSITFDKHLWDVDIKGSVAYAKALEKCGLVSSTESARLLFGLSQ